MTPRAKSRICRSPTRRGVNGRSDRCRDPCIASTGSIVQRSATPIAAPSCAHSTQPPRTMKLPVSHPFPRPYAHTSIRPYAHQMRPSKTVRESQHETSELMMPEHANNMGHVFGGVILSMMDKCAAIAAFRHSRAAVVTASIDRVDFREPIHLGDLVVMKASVNFAGRSSMEVGVRVEAEELLTGRRRHTNSCYLTFVAVDRNGRPIEVPELRPETDDELRRNGAAQERRRRRLEERQAEDLRKQRRSTESPRTE